MNRRTVLCLALAVALIVAAGIVLNINGGSDGFSLSSGAGAWAYLAAVGMVFGDAICPILPGETTPDAPRRLPPGARSTSAW